MLGKKASPPPPPDPAKNGGPSPTLLTIGGDQEDGQAHPVYLLDDKRAG